MQHFIPVIDGNIDVGTDVLYTSLIREHLWLDKVLDVVVNEHSVDDNVSWSACHALQCTKAAVMNSVNASFHESANTVAMIHHSLNVINQAVQHTNPGYTTVVVRLISFSKGCGQL